jgi:hypothetical protein
MSWQSESEAADSGTGGYQQRKTKESGLRQTARNNIGQFPILTTTPPPLQLDFRPRAAKPCTAARRGEAFSSARSVEEAKSRRAEMARKDAKPQRRGEDKERGAATRSGVFMSDQVMAITFLERGNFGGGRGARRPTS